MSLEFPPVLPTDVFKVAFYGPMASGKTTAAMSLFDRAHKLSLAAPLKKTALEYYGVTGKTNEERQILQELADDLKKWDNDVFTKRLLWDFYAYWWQNPGTPVVVDDLRFTHEADRLREHGFLLVRVHVPEEIRLARIKEKYPDTDPSRFEHKSEKDWKNIQYDYMIDGEGSEGVESLRHSIYQRNTNA